MTTFDPEEQLTDPQKSELENKQANEKRAEALEEALEDAESPDDYGSDKD